MDPFLWVRGEVVVFLGYTGFVARCYHVPNPLWWRHWLAKAETLALNGVAGGITSAYCLEQVGALFFGLAARGIVEYLPCRRAHLEVVGT